MLTKEELEAIKERCDKATEGPWEVAITADGGWVLDDTDNIVCGTCVRDEDAAFIAHSREDIPKLLAEIEALCPIEDSDAVNSLRTEKDYLTEIIAERDLEIERLRKSVEMAKKIVRGLTRENAVLKGEKPIPVKASVSDNIRLNQQRGVRNKGVMEYLRYFHF